MRSSSQQDLGLLLASDRFMASTTMSTEQIQTGVITKSVNGNVGLMLLFLNFVKDNGYETDSFDPILDYCLKNA